MIHVQYIVVVYISPYMLIILSINLLILSLNIWSYSKTTVIISPRDKKCILIVCLYIPPKFTKSNHLIMLFIWSYSPFVFHILNQIKNGFVFLKCLCDCSCSWFPVSLMGCYLSLTSVKDQSVINSRYIINSLWSSDQH